MLLGDVVGSPYRMLLVHNVATYHSSVLIDNNGSVTTFSDRADDTLRNTVTVVCVSELVKQLLLHIIGYDTFVWNRSPEVLVSVEIDDIRLSFYSHTGIDLFHVTLKSLCLRVIDTIACGGKNPQITV